ncbi:hypothetical protein MPSEU_000786400 [Mayamaea pseudoterrestris]|nr:hypothetical protein MPSEU_000786400 [Mayamaea pseudoterrestris]
MAPILTTATGMTLPPLSERLQKLLVDLHSVTADSVQNVFAEAGDSCFSVEQIDLHQWIEPINNLDKILRSCMEEYPQLLLLPPVPRMSKLNKPPSVKPASTLDEANSVPTETIQLIIAILTFWEAMLRNSTGKSVFNSVEECCDLLACGNDDVVDAALLVLQALAIPPALHRQQAPEMHGHGTALTNAHQICFARLTVLARGYTSRATGLGLYQLLTSRQPVRAVQFSYYRRDNENETCKDCDDKMEDENEGESFLREIVLDENEIMLPTVKEGSATKKRRRVTTQILSKSSDDDLEPPTRSTMELFFLALSKAKDDIHPERLFSLLADIRWSRSATLAAVNRRLAALTCILHSHPSPEVLNGYLTAQPELAAEIVDLLRPTVSANAVSSASAALNASRLNRLQQDGITWLADTQEIPFRTRILALESLTALAARRDGPTSGLLGSRLSSVLTELGVAKGQYLGLLPSLIRFSLASLGNVLAEKGTIASESPSGPTSPVIRPSLQLGLAFVEAIVPNQPSRVVQVRQALEMIDSVLTLTSAIIAVPSGASSLIDCGMIPALLSTISIDTDKTMQVILRGQELCDVDQHHIKALLHYIVAQAVQILEGAVVTSSSALTAFLDLKGVDSLTSRLAHEISLIPALESSISSEAVSIMMDVEESIVRSTTEVDVAGERDTTPISSSLRVLLFSIITCLTVVFHQENSASAAAAHSGGLQLRKREVADALIRIMDDVTLFGGHLASLVATLLADIMNNDPLIVHYVHESGIAKSFLRMVTGKQSGENHEPVMPPVAELVMAIPNVLGALSLTEDGAKAVKSAAPFPALLRIFYHPAFAMPMSRCLLNEVTSAFGTGLDEIMRHVERLKTDILASVAAALFDVLKMAEDLAVREALTENNCDQLSHKIILEVERTCLIQYIVNFAQLLEQILHNEGHCEPFVDAGGLDVLLKLFSASLPGGTLLLAHLSTLSSLSISTVHHSTIEDSLSLAIKCIQYRFDHVKMIRKIVDVVQDCLTGFEISRKALFGSDDLYFGLDQVQKMPFYIGDLTTPGMSKTALAAFFRDAAVLQWITSVLASTVKLLCQRGQESGADAWGSSESAWKKELSNENFCQIFHRLSEFYRSSLFEVCRVRTEGDFDSAEVSRLTTRTQNLLYKLRIVCPEGAVVRDGIEIDSCASVGSMEMGEIVLAYDRCINSSGILRWRTNRGWISEMTRGHGREPIAEVIDVVEQPEAMPILEDADNSKRIEAAIPDLRVVAVGLLARGQPLYSLLFAELSKLTVYIIRSIPVRTITFAKESASSHVALIVRMLSTSFMQCLNIDHLKSVISVNSASPAEPSISQSGSAIYFGSCLSQLQSSLFDERRERRFVNLPLLVDLISSDPYAKQLITGVITDEDAAISEVGILRACLCVLQQGMRLMSLSTQYNSNSGHEQAQSSASRLDRSVAASFPLIISLIRRLLTTPISSSPVASVMSRMKWKDISNLVGKANLDDCFVSSSSNDGFFEPERFVKVLNLSVSRLVHKAWQDPNLMFVPSHVMHPLVNLVGDVVAELIFATKEKGPNSSRQAQSQSGFSLSDYLRRRREADETEPLDEEEEVNEEEFEPDESIVAQLVDMGFNRDRALDALETTRSNRVEVGMEYALTHPPPSPATVERRRVAREEREARRTLEAQDAAAETSESHDNNPVADGASLSNRDADDAEKMELEEVNPVKDGAATENEDEVGELYKAEIICWSETIPSVICEVLVCIERMDKNKNNETVAITTVVSAFLLQLSSQYPEKSPVLLAGVFQRLKTEIDDFCVDPNTRDQAFAALCHAAVLVTRAIPKSRVLVLQNNLISSIVAAVNSSSKALTTDTKTPRWFSSALLLLDVMAEPFAGFADEEFSKSMLNGNTSSENDELKRVQAEHKTLATALGEATTSLFLAINESAGVPNSAVKEMNDGFASIPGYYPLIPISLSNQCLEICLDLLETGSTTARRCLLTPEVAQACLSLLVHLLRSPNASEACRKLGIAEAVVSLPATSKFTGNAALVAILLRRLLEDCSTLQAAMELEMRGIVAKLQAKKLHGSTDKSISVILRVFMDATTPLIRRDPLTFVKSLALAVKIEAATEGDPRVVLLPTAERTRNQALVANLSMSIVARSLETPIIHAGTDASRSSLHQKKEKSRRSLSAGRKVQKDAALGMKTGNRTSFGGPESPAAHVMAVLVQAVISSPLSNTDGNGIDDKFLWLGSLLEIIAELILVLPACASAIHNYRPKDKLARTTLTSQLQHALSGAPSPPKTFVNFLLHSVLPQDRMSVRSETEIWDKQKGATEYERRAITEKRKKAFWIAKSSQGAARVILALMMRPGEGRKRVVADLTFALSGGRLGHASTITPEGLDITHKFNIRELFALQAWAEMTIGIAAPRSSGRLADGMGAISIENIRIMLEAGIVHALVYGLHRIKLYHPMASITVAALLQPLDCLTRTSVSTSVNAMVSKEKAKLLDGNLASSEDGAHSLFNDPHQVVDESGSQHDMEMSIDDSSVVGGSRTLDSEGDENDDEDDEESDDEDSEMEDDSGDEGEDGEDQDENMDSESSESDEADDDELSEGDEWNDDDYGDLVVDGDEAQLESDLADDEVTDQVEQSVDDGWTRIESSSIGGIRNRPILQGNSGARMRGYVDAAEAMIGSLLQNGEISNEAMDEIGETLGIQLASQGRAFQAMLGQTMLGGDLRLVSATNPHGQRAIRVLGDNRAIGSSTGVRGEMISSLPYVSQRTQPDMNTSAFSGGQRGNEVTAIEFIFGGPTITAGSRYFNLVSSDSQIDDSTQPSLTQHDLQLFPEGPAPATSSRIQQPMHPLLVGVNLPPVNALVSDLPLDDSQGLRGESGTARSAGWMTAPDGGLLMSMTSGNVVRSFARTISGATGIVGVGNRSAAAPGLDGITDLGAQNLTSALERALAQTARPVSQSSVSAESPVETENVQTTLSDRTEIIQPSETDAHPNDGDIVASSLAEGLRLSPVVDNDAGVHPSHSGPHVFANATVSALSNAALPSENSPLDEGNENGAENQIGSLTTANEPEEPTQPAVLAHSPRIIDAAIENVLVCPPDVDAEVFSSLPLEMQQECVNQYDSTRELADQLSGSSLDPEVLAALPEDMRREVIEQERQERAMREHAQAPADPSHAEEMDNASFIASLAPDLREEILSTADDEFLNSLPPSIIAEAQLLRERASMQQRRMHGDVAEDEGGADAAAPRGNERRGQGGEQILTRRNRRFGKIRIEQDKAGVIYRPASLSSPFGKSDIMMLIELMYLQSPVRPSRLLQKLFHNVFADPLLRAATTSCFIRLLMEDLESSRRLLDALANNYDNKDDWRFLMDLLFIPSDFPPTRLLGSMPEATSGELMTLPSKRRIWQSASASIAANLPRFTGTDVAIPPVVSTRLIDTMLQICKASPRYCVHLLLPSGNETASGFEYLLDLLGKPLYNGSSTNLDQLLGLLEAAVAPLSHIAKVGDDEVEISEKDLSAAAAAGKQWIDAPRITISKARLQLLCSILRMEVCRDSSFTKVNTIVRRLCRVETNRGFVLGELAAVAHALGTDAWRDLRALKMRMENAAIQHQQRMSGANVAASGATDNGVNPVVGKASSVTLATSSSELKLLRVLQTLQSLCGENWDESGSKKNDSIIVTQELIHLLKQLDFGQLWDELSACLGLVQVLEGVKAFEDDEKCKSEEIEVLDDAGEEGDEPQQRQRNKLRNSAAGLLTRFMPAIEAFFVANASASRASKDTGSNDEVPTKISQDVDVDSLVDGKRVLAFVSTNRVLLNALIRNNTNIIDKGLRALVQVPRCRLFLDFDIKRQWFKSQLRRLRQQASRRHGSLRLHIRRKYVFEDAYHQLRLRNAEEMRGRLHVTFRNEEGVDAGGLSREFFGILSKEIFNPNYALFTSTEDGCTFQPNPNSSINPDHLSYFRFVGRIVGKAVADGFLLDVHFTRSIYKHMLGMTPTYHDMEAIDPDYYRNLKTILEYNLADIGLDLTFSIEDHSFGRSRTIDLVPDGRNIHVTDEDKEQYVRLVCQHRMTTAIQSQIKAYLDGFYEMVNPELIVIFTPRELELLISGLPDIDVTDLKANTDYVGYKLTDPEIVWFWNILFNLSRNDKATFLQFVTGSSKVPLTGFAELQGMRGIQKFSVHKVSGKKGSLMSAHTCFNQLDLPTYDSEEEMRTKLLLAINEGGGAFLFA